jgi:hypothetical protein
MNEKSFELFSKEHSSSEKFDYFVCSVAGALFAYIGQTYTPHTFDSWFYYLTPIALLALTLCFCCGFILIKMSNDITRLNKVLYLEMEEGERLTKLLRTDQKEFTNSYGVVASRESIEKERNEELDSAEEIRKEINSKDEKAAKWIYGRNSLLALGFILILLSKVLQPYFATK